MLLIKEYGWREQGGKLAEWLREQALGGHTWVGVWALLPPSLTPCCGPLTAHS